MIMKVVDSQILPELKIYSWAIIVLNVLNWDQHLVSHTKTLYISDQKTASDCLGQKTNPYWELLLLHQSVQDQFLPTCVSLSPPRRKQTGEWN